MKTNFEHDPLVHAAKESFDFVRRTCIYGADNKIQDLVATGFIAHESIVKRQIYAFEPSLDGMREGFFKSSLKALAQDVLQFRLGRCHEQSALTAIHLLSQGISDLKIFTLQNGNHTFLIAGLGEGRLEDPESVPKNAVVVDPWGENAVYNANDFMKKKENTPYLVGEPICCWTFSEDGIKELEYQNIEELQEQLQAFIQEHFAVSEEELRSNKLIGGSQAKPQKLGHEPLLDEIQERKGIPIKGAKVNVQTFFGASHSCNYKDQRAKDYVTFELQALFFKAIYNQRQNNHEARLENIQMQDVYPFYPVGLPKFPLVKEKGPYFWDHFTYLAKVVLKVSSESMDIYDYLLQFEKILDALITEQSLDKLKNPKYNK